ncbi:MAG: hypothetical protein IIX07_07245, partial [Lachnospiraceae bacterium]|nr:hypothetical protein [Lachnospiraceae bacterium]
MNSNLLVQFYIEQYELACQKKRRNAKRPSGYEERLVRMARTLKKGNPRRMSSGLLEEYHRQIFNLAYFAYRSQSKGAIRRINEEILPELFRLDLGLLMPDEQEFLDEGFIDYTKDMTAKEIVTQPLYEIFREY